MPEKREIMLNRNFKRVNDETDNLIAELSGERNWKRVMWDENTFYRAVA